MGTQVPEISNEMNDSERYELARVVVGDKLVVSCGVYDHKTCKISPPMSEEAARRLLDVLRRGWELGSLR